MDGNMKQIGIFFISVFLFTWVQVQANSSQQRTQSNDHTVTGVVTDASSGNLMPGVNISVKGTTTGTTTGEDGSYELVVPSPSDTLVFSFVGYKSKEVAINGRSKIDVVLAAQTLQGDEIIVTGYQETSRSEIVGSVSSVDAEEIQGTPSATPSRALQGRLAGVEVVTDGSPGGGAQIRIRGVSTLNNNDPLYVIDGVPTKSGAFDDLNPQDIESLQVLKDASATSIYGARASNGVIVVTTKQGAQGSLEIDYSSNVTISQYASKLEPLNTRERGQVLWRAAINDGRDPANLPIYDYDWETDSNGNAQLNEIIIPEYLGDPSEGIRTADTDWFDEISRMGVINQHNLTVSTGNERGSGLFSLRFHNNESIIKEQDFNRLSARVNSSFNFLDGDLTIGENLSISRGKGTPLPSGLGGEPQWVALIAQPILPVYTEDGDFAGPIGAGFDDRDNPVRLLEHNRWDNTNSVNIFGDVHGSLSILDNLEAKVRFGVDWERYQSRDIQRTYQTGFLSRATNSLNRTKNDELNWTFNSTLEYDTSFDNHNFNVLAGTEAIKNTFQSTFTSIEDFVLETEDFFVEDAGTGNQTVAGGETGFMLLSYFGKLDYDYDGKYLASFTLRHDGSSRFGENNRFGTFPAMSVGWRLYRESFVQDNIPFLSDLKLRYGWGVTGNQEIDNLARFSLYAPNYGVGSLPFEGAYGTAYDLAGANTGNLTSGFSKLQTGNPNLKWEESAEHNMGIDFGLFEQKLTASFDYFLRTTKDILISPAFIGAQGEGGSRFVNGATVDSRGFETVVGYNQQFGEFDLNVKANVTRATDEIAELPAEVVRSYPGNVEKTILGRSQNSLFGYVADGIFQNQDEVNAHADQSGKGVGRLRFKDLNNDGEINALDQKYLGVSTPEFSYGLNLQGNYKGFDLSVFLQGVYGNEVYNGRKIYTDFTSIWNGANYGRRTLDAWTPQNSDSSIPALSLSDDNGESRYSSYFIEDGSYLKLRQIRLGYTLPQDMVSIANLKSIRLYLLGENLLTIKDNSGDDAFTSPDPENPGNAFPRPRNFSLGINIKL